MANGLCVKCGKRPPIEGRTKCAECIGKTKEYAEGRDKLYDRLHLCRWCGGTDAYTLNGHAYCFECSEKKRLMERQRTADNPEQKKANNSRWIERCKAEGLCIECGKPMNGGPHVRCDSCRAKYRNRHQKVFTSQTLCASCQSAPPIAGKKLCQSCYDRQLPIILRAGQISAQRRHERELQNGLILDLGTACNGQC